MEVMRRMGYDEDEDDHDNIVNDGEDDTVYY